MNMNEHHFSLEELGAASVVAGLAGKRDREGDSPDAAGGENAWKKTRAEENEAEIEIPYDEDHEPVPLAQVIANMQRQAAAEAAEAAAAAAPHQQQEFLAVAPSVAPVPAEQRESNEDEDMAPYPFYYYKDYSQTPDPDSLTPLTPPGRVPAFPAKMHAILSRPDLKDIIQWQHHGRSWKVLKPREFEVRVIPTYFEHAKFSSFVRQANGWGFRRITTGRDRNSYYHPLFLRGLPHLCKEMKRPGVAKKLPADPDHEPDLAKISELYPVPLEPVDKEAILLPCVLQGGPKARMPIYSGLSSSTTGTATTWKMPPEESKKVVAANMIKPQAPQWTPRDQEVYQSFGQSLGMNSAPQMPAAPKPQPAPAQPQASGPHHAVQLPANSVAAPKPVSTLSAANNLAFDPSAMMQQAQFAAGFAAAAAMMQSFQQMGQFQQQMTQQQPHHFQQQAQQMMQMRKN